MLNKSQIKLIQTAVRAAGLRSKMFDGRYRLLLSHYLQPNGSPATSCKQLNNTQLDDLLAICESHGWQMPGKADDFCRRKIVATYYIASFAQQAAIKYLARDLGWDDCQLGGFVKRMTRGEMDNIAGLDPRQAYAITEALKAMLGRQAGKKYANLQQIQDELEAARDGTSQA